MLRNKATKCYLRKLRQILPGTLAQKRRILKQIEMMLREYLNEHQNAEYDALLLRFGTPEEIAQTFLETMDEGEAAKRLQIKSLVLKIVLATAMIVILLWAGVVGAAYLRYIDDHNGYFQITVETEANVTIGE